MKKNRQKGVSLIVTFFILTIISAVVLGIIAILYSQIKVVRNMGNSIASYYAAESGIEKVSYYDRNVIPYKGSRGICYMCDPDLAVRSCLDCKDCKRSGGLNECASDKCTNCTVEFRIDLGQKIYYNIEAKIFPAIPPAPPTFTITAIGSYKDVKRAIQITPMPVR